MDRQTRKILLISDSDQNAPLASPTRRSVTDVGAKWSDTQKIEAVTTWLMLGNGAQTAKVLGIPLITFRVWKASAWWKEIESELRVGEKLILSARLKNIVDKALEQVTDRLENGELKYNSKKGELYRQPVQMKDANKVLADMIDRREKLVTTEQHQMQEEGVKEKLEKLAKSFEEFANKQANKPVVNVTDVIFQKEE